jgi:hypothetical protein
MRKRTLLNNGDKLLEVTKFFSSSHTPILIYNDNFVGKAFRFYIRLNDAKEFN